MHKTLTQTGIIFFKHCLASKVPLKMSQEGAQLFYICSTVGSRHCFELQQKTVLTPKEPFRVLSDDHHFCHWCVEA